MSVCARAKDKGSGASLTIVSIRTVDYKESFDVYINIKGRVAWEIKFKKKEADGRRKDKSRTMRQTVG